MLAKGFRVCCKARLQLLGWFMLIVFLGMVPRILLGASASGSADEDGGLHLASIVMSLLGGLALFLYGMEKWRAG